tara:strand:+ start:3409 stop:3783 length:375 start_codon:yes stop_codon:yes gene_type:complete
MTFKDKEQHLDFLKNSITYLQNLGYKNIKADMEGFETPKSYFKKGSNVSITPDIVAEKEGRKHIFDISLKTPRTNLLKSKWLFLDAFSILKSHSFKLITTRGHYKFTNEMLNDINLTDKKLIKL